jgi:epoxide hydrolase 4
VTRPGTSHAQGGALVAHLSIHANGMCHHVVEAGPRDGPLMLLLHGFPEGWYGWRAQIPSLARAGYRVWAPDGRGYGLSDKPPSVAAYGVETIVDDVRGLIAAAGRASAHVVGHDWGGAIAWRFAERYPEHLERLAILNAPHPWVFAHTLRANPKQRRKSAYFALFQLPVLPEMLLRARDCRILERSLVRSSRPGTFSTDDLAAYRRAWARPGALKGMLDWYRAALRSPVQDERLPRIRAPTLVLWGVQDAALEPAMAQESVALCDDARLVTFEGAGHWLQHEEPERVGDALVRFFAEHGGTTE